MNSTRRTGGSGTRRPRRVALAVTASRRRHRGHRRALGLPPAAARDRPAGCGRRERGRRPTEIVGIRTFTAPAGIRVEADLEYGTREDGTLLTLDICRPAAADRVPRDGRRRPAPRSLDPRRQLGPRRQGERRLAQRVHVARERGLRRGIRQLPPRARRRLPGRDRRRRPRGRMAACPRAGRAVRHRPRQHRRVRRVGGRQPRGAARHHRRRPARRGHRASPRSPSSRARSASAPPSSPADEASDWMRGIIGDYLGCEPDASDAECPQAADASPGDPRRPERPPVLHRPRRVRRSCRSGSRSGSRRPSLLPACPSSSRSCRAVEHSIGILDEGLRARVAAFLHAHLG